jgi:predicted MFS family arabinose efflux permease
MSERGTIWTRDFVIHTLSYLLMATSFYFLLPTLPLYVVNELGESNSSVGYIIGIYAFSALLIRPFSGYGFDTFGRKNIYLLSLLLFALIIAGYFFAATFFLLLLVRFLHGISWGVLTTGGATIAADLVPASKRGEGIGFFGLSFTLAMAIGPVVAFQVLGDNNFNRLFIATIVVGFFSFLLANFTRYPGIKKKDVTPFGWDDLFEPKVLKISLVMMITAISYAGIFSFITMYGRELGIQNSGSFFLTYAVGVSIFRPVAGKIMDRSGPASLIIFSFTISMIGLLFLTFVDSFVLYLLAGFLIGIGHGIVTPVLQTMIINMVTPENRGRANSTFFSSLDLGFGIGSIFLGYLAEWSSLTTMFRFSAFLLLIPLVYFYFQAYSDYKRNSLSTP